MARGARRPGRLLVLICALAAALEAGLVTAVGPHDAIGSAPQVSALAPVAILHDLRWLLVFHDSLLTFVLEAVALVAFRTLFTACCLRLSWPADVPHLTLPRLLWRALSLTLAVALLLSPVAALLFGMAVVSVSYFLLGAVPIAVVVFLATAHGGAASWWRHAPTPAALGWVVLDLLSVTAAGALAVAAPAPVGVLVAAAGGAANAAAWRGVVAAMQRRHRRLRFRPVAPAAVVTVVAAALLTVTGVVSAHAGPPYQKVPGHGPQHRAAAAPPRGGAPVLLVTGFGAGWNGQQADPLGPGFTVARFSYRGLSRSGTPLPYSSGATDQPLGSLVRLVAAQVQALATRTGAPVNIVAASEGALAAKAYLAADPRAPVASLVMLSPLLDPARVYFPPPNSPGWGMVAGDSVRAVLAGLDATTPLTLRADEPLVRSIDDHAAMVRALMGCPLPGVRQFAVIPLADAAGAPYDQKVSVPSAILVAFHGTLIGQPEVDRLTAAFLTGTGSAGDQWRSVPQQALRAVASAWQVPTLPLQLNHAWGQPTGGSCPAVRGAMRGWLAPTLPS